MSNQKKKPNSWPTEEAEIIKKAKESKEISGQDLIRLIFGATENKKKKPSKKAFQSCKEKFNKFIEKGIKEKKLRLINQNSQHKAFDEYLFKFKLVCHYIVSEKFNNQLETISYLNKNKFSISRPLRECFRDIKNELDSGAKLITTELEQLNNLMEGPYNGVTGSLPEWMPEPLKQEFHYTRIALLETKKFEEDATNPEFKDLTYSGQDILKFMNSRKHFLSEVSWFPAIPEGMVDKIDALNYIKSIADLGKEKGIEAYLGKGGFAVLRGVCISERQRKAAKKPRQDGLSSFIFKLLKKKPNLSNEQILDEIKRNEHQAPIGIVSDDIIEFYNPPGWKNAIVESKISALPRRIDKIKEKLKKA